MRSWLQLGTALAVLVGGWAVYRSVAQPVTTPAVGAAVCAYNASPSTVSSGQFVLMQCNNKGSLQ